LDQEHRCKFAPAHLVPHIRLKVHNPDGRQRLDKLGVADISALASVVSCQWKGYWARAATATVLLKGVR
jgi:hypothetical protein